MQGGKAYEVVVLGTEKQPQSKSNRFIANRYRKSARRKTHVNVLQSLQGQLAGANIALFQVSLVVIN
jgi:hypothetical protein